MRVLEKTQTVREKRESIVESVTLRERACVVTIDERMEREREKTRDWEVEADEERKRKEKGKESMEEREREQEAIK